MIKPSHPIYNVTVEYDEEANIFIAYSDDIPGLATEAGSFQDIVKRVCEIAPELLELNDGELQAPEYLAFEQKAIYVPFVDGAGVCG